jgi:hypothetical protein
MTKTSFSVSDDLSNEWSRAMLPRYRDLITSFLVQRCFSAPGYQFRHPHLDVITHGANESMTLSFSNAGLHLFPNRLSRI